MIELMPQLKLQKELIPGTEPHEQHSPLSRPHTRKLTWLSCLLLIQVRIMLRMCIYKSLPLSKFLLHVHWLAYF